MLDKNGWMMYGTSKPEGSPYILTGIWEYLNEEDIGNHPPKRKDTSPFYTPSKNLVHLLSIRRFTMADLATIRPEESEVLDTYVSDFNERRET